MRPLRLKKVLALACGLLSGGALFAIMALTFFDVGGRKLLENSIPGSLELTELLMVFGIDPRETEQLMIAAPAQETTLEPTGLLEADDVLPGRVIRMQHEDLLDDPEIQVRRLLTAIGVPFAPNLFATLKP